MPASCPSISTSAHGSAFTDSEPFGIGTFTVRVFFYGDRYAGTWQHGSVGGHMSGRIEKQAPATEP